MTGIVSPNSRDFLLFYYENLCNDIIELRSLYSNSSVLTISFDNGPTNVFTEKHEIQLKNIVKKPIQKVFISNVVPQEIENSLVYFHVLGQLVFSDKTQKRFVHNFFLKVVEGRFLIVAETIVVLDEEIIYETRGDSALLTITKGKQDIGEVVSLLENFGTVTEVKIQNNVYKCQMTSLGLNASDIVEKVSEKGLKVQLN